MRSLWWLKRFGESIGHKRAIKKLFISATEGTGLGVYLYLVFKGEFGSVVQLISNNTVCLV